MQALSDGYLNSTIMIWENARDLLATALKSYLDSCTSLEVEFGCTPSNTNVLASRAYT
ncbi:hypothetical protein RSAG8_06363, partial [Rhizoctonia solani AG-8 WAC10335]